MRSFVSMLGFFSLVSRLSLTHSFMMEDRVRSKIRSKGQPADLSSEGSDAGGLFLTPLIKKGQFNEAQRQAAVPPLMPGVESFSGFITVNATCNSNTFFWLFKALEGDWLKQPLIVWLQGGPGVTSLLGLFRLIGPFFVDEKEQLQKRPQAWNQKYNVLFVDNPVGVGYSFTDSCCASSEADVARDLYSFLQQFYAMFPALNKNQLYIAGESYAARYQISLAHHIYLENKKAKEFAIPLVALLIGSGNIDPKNMMKYGDYMYQLGMIDNMFLEQIHKDEDQMRALISAGEYGKAERLWNDGIFNKVYTASGVKSLYNWLHDDVSLDGPDFKFVVKPEVRKAIHVGERVFTSNSDPVYDHLVLDVMKSVKPQLEDLLNWGAYEIVSFGGQMDIICAYPLNFNVFLQLVWKLAEDYKKKQRCFYMIGDRIVGYYKNVGPFTEMMFRGCGHLLPADCPEQALDMLHRVVTNITSFKTDEACPYFILE